MIPVKQKTTLITPKLDKSLILYVSTTYTSIGVVLGHLDEDKNERVVYYLNRVMVDYEKKYTNMEKTFLAPV